MNGEAVVIGIVILSGFGGFIVGLYTAVWYINRLRRAAGLRPI